MDGIQEEKGEEEKLRTNYQGVLGELLEEALLGGAVNVEVESLGRQQQGCKCKHREQHRVHGEGRYS